MNESNPGTEETEAQEPKPETGEETTEPGREAARDEQDDAEKAREALEAAIAEHPEEVAAFVERLGLVNELLDTTELATSAMDDEMVTRLARTGGSLGEVADTASDPDTVRGIETLLRAVGEAGGGDPPERVGTLGTIRALRDPEVQRGMVFVLALARGIGSDLDRRDATE